jgi:hypothetical protein
MYSENEVLELARRAYKAGEATFQIAAERCALLVIDMQDEFVKPGWTPYWVPRSNKADPDDSALGRDLPYAQNPRDLYGVCRLASKL